MRTRVFLLVTFLALPVHALDLEEAAAEGRLSYFMPTQATDTFDANFGGGEDFMLGFGGIWKFENGLFVEGALDYYKETGEKVYVGGGQTTGSGFETDITIIPITASAGWTFMKDSRVSPMIGGGIGYHLVDVSDGEADNSIGYHILGGAEFLKNGTFGLAAEVKLSFVPDALGHGGTSKLFGEDDVGGITITMKALWRYWR